MIYNTRDSFFGAEIKKEYEQMEIGISMHYITKGDRKYGYKTHNWKIKSKESVS